MHWTKRVGEYEYYIYVYEQHEIGRGGGNSRRFNLFRPHQFFVWIAGEQAIFFSLEEGKKNFVPKRYKSIFVYSTKMQSKFEIYWEMH
jgi:hypothetical protein